MLDLLMLIIIMILTGFGIFFSHIPVFPDSLLYVLWGIMLFYIFIRIFFGKFFRNREVTIVLFTLLWLILSFFIAWFI
ncbi:hypothetical protein, partial [Brochothrix thermosphacta]|uniref:hypothetical protein n=1 Tax=Brochothrix thermosphacta TaxID=2756 RepID=UPI001C402582